LKKVRNIFDILIDPHLVDKNYYRIANIFKKIITILWLYCIRKTDQENSIIEKAEGKQKLRRKSRTEAGKHQASLSLSN